MFSVNNFYEFFSSHYGWDNAQIMPWHFQVHGSKNFVDLVARYDYTKYLNQQHVISTHGTIIMHDQEPFMLNLLDTYRQSMFDEKKETMWLKMTDQELILLRTVSCSWPVFCQTDLRGKDLEFIQDSGMINCYYFWHGLVSRDWFRHWKHHKDLTSTIPKNQRFLLYARDHTCTRKYRQSLIDSLTPLQSQIKYNWTGNELVPSDYSAKIVVEDAVKTSVHIVAETLFNSDKLYITEKVFKPMVMRQPFIIAGGVGILSHLRNYGFQTFDSVWDESYDNEIDHDQRLQKIISLIHNLYNKSDQEFNDIMRCCQNIVNHNQEHFFSERFEKILLDELHKNVRSGLEIQNYKMQQDPGGSFFYVVDQLINRGVELAPWLQESIYSITQVLKQQQPVRYQKIQQHYKWI